jgi:hypothetical protein
MGAVEMALGFAAALDMEGEPIWWKMVKRGFP